MSYATGLRAAATLVRALVEKQATDYGDTWTGSPPPGQPWVWSTRGVPMHVKPRMRRLGSGWQLPSTYGDNQIDDGLLRDPPGKDYYDPDRSVEYPPFPPETPEVALPRAGQYAVPPLRQPPQPGTPEWEMSQPPPLRSVGVARGYRKPAPGPSWLERTPPPPPLPEREGGTPTTAPRGQGDVGRPRPHPGIPGSVPRGRVLGDVSEAPPPNP